METTSFLQGVFQCGVEHLFLGALTKSLAITQHGHTAGALWADVGLSVVAWILPRSWAVVPVRSKQMSNPQRIICQF